jgi:predicted RNA binding protein YcfA (HicA-like mRNA interferase family)
MRMAPLDLRSNMCISMAKSPHARLEFNSRKLLKMLEKDGWVHKRTNGDHHTFRKKGVKHPVVLVHPKKDLPIGLVRKIYKDAGWRT